MNECHFHHCLSPVSPVRPNMQQLGFCQSACPVWASLMSPSLQGSNIPAGYTACIVGCSSVPSHFYQNGKDLTLQRLWNACLPFHTTSSFQAVISSFSFCSVCPTLGFWVHTTVLLLKNLHSGLPIFFLSFSAVHPSHKN